MTGTCASLDIRSADGLAQDGGRRAELASLLLAAAQPYADALYGERHAGQAIFTALMSRPSSEFSPHRVQVLFDGTEACGCYVALRGSDLPACRRAELVEALRYFGGAAAASLAGRLASLASLFAPVESDAFYLGKLAIRPEWRGRGLGRVLLDHYLARGRQVGLRRFRLDLSGDNHTARRLYESAGFRVVETRRDGSFGLTYLAMAAEW